MPLAPAPTPKKRRTGLIVAIVVIALVVVIGGVGGGILLTRKGNTSNAASTPGATSTTASAATATAGAPAGFQQFKNSEFSILYPKDWQPMTAQDKEVFKRPNGDAGFVVQVSSQTTQPKAADDMYCLTANPTQRPTATTISLGGQQWTREDCGSVTLANQSHHAAVESVMYKNKLYTISYTSSPADTFASDRSKYFTPMEQSFTFLT